jgi:adenine-specific DNA-methyltransferase
MDDLNKPKFKTPDLTAENIEKLAELFPGVVAEGKVNVDLLRTYVGEEIFGDEAYEFTWVGKRAAIMEAGCPIRKTLRPCHEESRDWDTTENLYIEGDNLDVLKLLQESYLGKVKMIYIDPPYNTGNDFVYRDDFSRNREDYEDEAGMYDEADNRLFKNTETNGRFHSDWCSMIYPRLVLARNLLRDDGAIFISCDDNEQANIKKMCDEIFGNVNFVDVLIWKKMYGGKNDSKWFLHYHDYIMVYAKSKNDWYPNLLPRTDKQNDRYKNPDNDPRGPWKSGDFTGVGVSPSCIYPITTPSGRIVHPPAGKRWISNEITYNELLADNRIWFGSNGSNVPSIKRFLAEVKDGVSQSTFLDYSEVGHSDEANKELRNLLGGAFFDYPKPLRLMYRLALLGIGANDIVLDFFSGSATTAHAVMQLNAEDGGNRKFIMVQLPEVTDEKSEAYKAGYHNICEIGKERIRRAGDKIKAEAGMIAENLDIGFRVLKLDDTNMNDVYYAPADYTQDLVAMTEDNIKPDRTDMDLLFGCLLDWGLPLSMPHTHEEIDGFTVHTYNGGDLIACFDMDISEAAIREIAKRCGSEERKGMATRAVFRDISFASSPEKINVFEIFKLLAPNTNVRVI